MTERPVMIITGTSRGIGMGLARHFLSLGYRVAGCSRGPSPWEADEYVHSQVDVGDEAQVVEWVRRTRHQQKRIDALVCNAALSPPAQLLTMTTAQQWHEAMRTNLDGTFFVCREVAKQMMAQRSGRLVTVTSMASALHIEGTAAYASSKSAVVEMTKVLARELASTGITCNTVGISIVETDLTQALGDAVRARALERLTLKRALDIDEVCSAVEFFCSPRNGSVTGQVLQLGLVT